MDFAIVLLLETKSRNYSYQCNCNVQQSIQEKSLIRHLRDIQVHQQSLIRHTVPSYSHYLVVPSHPRGPRIICSACVKLAKKTDAVEFFRLS